VVRGSDGTGTSTCGCVSERARVPIRERRHYLKDARHVPGDECIIVRGINSYGVTVVQFERIGGRIGDEISSISELRHAGMLDRSGAFRLA